MTYSACTLAVTPVRMVHELPSLLSASPSLHRHLSILPTASPPPLPYPPKLPAAAAFTFLLPSPALPQTVAYITLTVICISLVAAAIIDPRLLGSPPSRGCASPAEYELYGLVRFCRLFASPCRLHASSRASHQRLGGATTIILVLINGRPRIPVLPRRSCSPS